jgi:hypothetical protein
VAVLLAAVGMLTAPGLVRAQSLCGGLLQPPCLPPSPPPPVQEEPVAATIALTPASAMRRVDSKKPVRLHGGVSGVANPQGLVVELLRAVPGYGTAGSLEPLVTPVKEDGTFEFELRPRITLDVQALLRGDQRATGKSPARRITVRSIQSLTLSAVTKTRGRFVLTSVGPRSVPLATGNVAPRAGEGHFGYLYLISKSRRFGMRIGFGRARNRACGDLCKRSVIGRFRITNAIVAEKRDFLACARSSLFLSVWDAAVSDDCGKPRIALRGAT